MGTIVDTSKINKSDLQRRKLYLLAVIMASLLRNFARQGCRSLSQINRLPVRFVQPAAHISTSKKNKDAASVPLDATIKKTEEPEKREDDPNWMSYGYSYTDRTEDEFGYHMVLFSVSLLAFWFAFLTSYMPDYKIRHWAQREAHLEIARREREGLPLIDINLIPADKVILPSEEELGEDFEIII